MGMNLRTELVMGVKRTRGEWKGSGIDLYEIQSPELHVALSEDHDMVVVGKLVAKTDEYASQLVEEVFVPGQYEVWAMLGDYGVSCLESDVKLYIVGCWG